MGSPLQGRVAVFGGSFDPPHVAHQMVVLYVLETQPVDHLVCLPSYRHPFDKQLAPYADRVDMCHELVAPFGPRASVSTIEEELGGEHSRSLTVLQALAARAPAARLRFVVGADILGERDKWWRWSDIEALAPSIVVGRTGFPGPFGVALPEISSTEIRARIAAGQSIEGLVPRSVIQVLQAKGLYRS